MHMARLYDSGKMFRQYSLSALTKDYAEDIKSVAKAYVEKQKQNID